VTEKHNKRAILILGDQLDLDSSAFEDFDPKTDEVIMIESVDEASYVWSHKAKITLFLSAMRHFAEEVKKRCYPLTYIKESKKSLHDELKVFLIKHQIKTLVCVEPGEWRIKKNIENMIHEIGIDLEIRPDKHFFCTTDEFKEWAKDRKEFRLEYFYRYLRKKHNILLEDDGNPVGGKWNFDQDNRKPYPKKGPGWIDAPTEFEPDQTTQEVIQYVNQQYKKHPGKLTNFYWAVTREQALTALDYFLEYRLRNFGIYQDAMWTNTPFGWHSVLSSALNLKLLNPREVIEKTIHAWKKYQLDISTIEGFVRQILGWREFVRGMYFLDMPKMAEENYYKHQRKLPIWYWTGRTNMACMEDAIGQTLEYGYAHHIQRLMVTGNFALLAEILPKEVCDWYLAVYVDAIEWVELPNTAGMALYANGGRFTSKPYIASGAYIKRMSNYCNNCKYKPDTKYGELACPVTALYWNFLINHQNELEASQRTRLMVANVKRISEDEQQLIQQHANHLLNHLDDL